MPSSRRCSSHDETKKGYGATETFAILGMSFNVLTIYLKKKKLHSANHTFFLNLNIGYYPDNWGFVIICFSNNFN